MVYRLLKTECKGTFKGNRQVIGRIDKKCRESDNVRMTYVNDDSDG